MDVADFTPPEFAFAPLFPPQTTATPIKRSRPPGHEIFPALEGVGFVVPPHTAVNAVAAGEVLALSPLTLAHDYHLLTCYTVDALPAVAVGDHVAVGQTLVHSPGRVCEVRFACGVSLAFPRRDHRHFMPLDPRPMLQSLGVPPPANGRLWRGDVPLAAVPLFLQRALVAVEDQRFYRHAGIDPRSLIRTLLTNIRQRRIVMGGSTITQQAARSALQMTRRTWVRKLLEMPIAVALDWYHDKDTILELYFNAIYWGRGATNVASAAVAFFGKNVWALNLRECSLLAALPNHPLRWDIDAADVARLERKGEIVIATMLQHGAIDAHMAALARSQTYTLVTY